MGENKLKDIFGALSKFSTNEEKVEYLKNYNNPELGVRTQGQILMIAGITQSEVADLGVGAFSTWNASFSGEFLPLLQHYLINETKKREPANGDNRPHNIIYFGAPGTGKSHMLNNDAKKYFGAKDEEWYDVDTGERGTGFYNDSHYSRVTFHSDYSYAQFVGSYKPTVINGKIKFKLKNKFLEILKKDIDINDKIDKVKKVGNIEDGKEEEILKILALYYKDEHPLKETDEFVKSYNSHGKHKNFNHDWAIFKYFSDNCNEYLENTDSDISYSFVPGAFVKTLVAALNNSEENQLLIIEEINRAEPSAVFGDVFQLLDRDDEGCSQYSITTSEDLRKFLNSGEVHGGLSDIGKQNLIRTLKKDDGYVPTENDLAHACDNIAIPNNMYIWATMNSADQGVFPMDTAFKRRWSFKYIPINNREDDVQKIWNDWRVDINRKLSENEIEEDKLLGSFFLSNSLISADEDIAHPVVLIDMDGNLTEFAEEFKNKVIMYLYEDAGKFIREKLFGRQNITLSEIHERFDSWAKSEIDVNAIKMTDKVFLGEEPPVQVENPLEPETVTDGIAEVNTDAIGE
jgi:hypothetical protein